MRAALAILLFISPAAANCQSVTETDGESRVTTVYLSDCPSKLVDKAPEISAPAAPKPATTKPRCRKGEHIWHGRHYRIRRVC